MNSLTASLATSALRGYDFWDREPAPHFTTPIEERPQLQSALGHRFGDSLQCGGCEVHFAAHIRDPHPCPKPEKAHGPIREGRPKRDGLTEQILKLRNRGFSKGEIARKAECSRTTVARVLVAQGRA